MASSNTGLTHRGSRWELRHSLWMLWIFTLGFFNWVGFLYIGTRVREQRWIAWGVFYSCPFILAMIFAERNEAVMDTVVVPLTLILGVAGIIHALRIRPEYLKRLVARQDTGAPKRGDFYPPEQRRSREHSLGAPAAWSPPATPSEHSGSQTPPQQVASTPPDSGTALELNGATEGEIASLPGIGPILAKRAVAERDRRDGFRSVDELGESLDLKPHAIERLRPLVTVSPRSRAPESETGRAGRLIDF